MMDATALLCNICPKKPRFSDVSHLLTHVSSKAHLSHYFKLQVRSHHEPQAIILLDEYDRWYKANNLAKLLSDRLSSKDARKKKIEGKAAAHVRPCPAKRNHEHQSPPVTVCPPLKPPLPDNLDPRLVGSFPNVEHEDSNKCTSASANYVTATPPSNSSQTHAEPNYPLHPTLVFQTPKKSTARRWKQEHALDSDDEGASVLQRTPCWSRVLGQTAEMATQLLNRQRSYDPFVDDNESEVDKDRVDEIARLKGVLWPGMDIFDSATEQMRRKRNQKKDESILRMMEKTSMGVEPTELVFSPTGILRKQRVISGNVEDSSPLKGETPIPRRRTTRLKRALSQADPNLQHGRDRKRKKKATKRGLTPVGEDMDPRGLDLTRATLTDLPICGSNHLSRGENPDDFALTFGGHDSKSRHGMKVFCDTSNQDMPVMRDHFCGQGLQYELPASSDSLFLQQEAPGNRSPSSILSNDYISNFAERLCRFTTDKENIEPLLDAHGRIDPLVGWHSPAVKRHLVSDAGYPSQFFFGDGQHIGLSIFEDHNSHAGYSYNPLAASFPKLPTEENPIYTTNAKHGLTSQDGTHATSPEATISDIEEGDFERLYLDVSSC
jgi:hypothetical protein